MKRPSPLGTADRRPRIHIWPRREGADFSFGPCGARSEFPTIGRAVEVALAAVNHAPSVIIFEGADHG